MIVYMRGTSGAGKSHIGFQFVETYPWEPYTETGWLKNEVSKQVAYKLSGDLYVLGRYKPGVPTGGVDGWDYNSVFGLIERCAQRGHVYVEARSSYSVDRLNDWNKHYGLTVCYLDTPLEVCVDQVYKRRSYGKRAIDAPLNVAAMRSQRESLFKQADRYHQLGFKTKVIDHTRAFDAVRSIFWQAGWRPT